MAIIRRVVIVAAFMACAILAGAVATAQTSFSTIDGEIGPGALYRIHVPTAVPWNGELVVFLQGIGDPADAIALSGPGSVTRDALMSQGFALIFTSRSVNGYAAVKDGMIRTHQLRGIFNSLVGEPTRVYLLGRSLGGLIAVMLAEMFPTQYDGVISGCGLLGGGATELTYVGDARMLFDYFLPGILPSIFDPPVGFSPGDPLYTEVLQALQSGLVSPGQPTLQFARTARLEAATNAEIVTAGISVVGFGLRQFYDLLDVTHGHMPYDNSEPKTLYAGSDNDAALNDGVARFVGEPSALEYMEHYYTPTGDLRIPVITLHKTRDPLVPRLLHEDKYATAVQNAGVSQYLLQRTVNGFGHCGFPNDELTAFAALVQWVHTGVRPQH
jgi:pimeloyl-ACP methyl ester carboxylesterase